MTVVGIIVIGEIMVIAVGVIAIAKCDAVTAVDVMQIAAGIIVNVV